MRLTYLLILISSISLVITSIVNYYFVDLLNLIAFGIGIVSLIFGIVIEISNRKSNQISLDENRIQHLQIINEISNKDEENKYIIEKNKQLEKSNTKLQQLMERVTFQLKEEHLDKNELLRKIDSPLYALLVYKSQEIDTIGTKSKPLREKIMFEAGFKFIKGSRGAYILSPSKVPPFKTRDEIDNWIKQNILEKIPKSMRYVIAYISLIDLRFTFSIKNDNLTKKYELLFDVISSEELLNISQGLTYLQNKKKLSIKDIINIPNLYFLSDKTSLSYEEKMKLHDNNHIIITNIEKKINKSINTKDIAEMDILILKEGMNDIISLSDDDLNTIKINAQFWVDFLENKKEN